MVKHYYGGSAQEARNGWEAFRLREQCRKYGYAIRREKGKVVISPNAPPNDEAEPPRHVAIPAREFMADSNLPRGKPRGFLCLNFMTMKNKLNIHHESQSPLMGLVVSVVEKKNKTVYLSILTKSGEIISGKFKEDVKMS